MQKGAFIIHLCEEGEKITGDIKTLGNVSIEAGIHAAAVLIRTMANFSNMGAEGMLQMVEEQFYNNRDNQIIVGEVKDGDDGR